MIIDQGGTYIQKQQIYQDRRFKLYIETSEIQIYIKKNIEFPNEVEVQGTQTKITIPTFARSSLKSANYLPCRFRPC